MKILAEPIEAAVWFKSKEKPHPVKFRYSDSAGTIRKVNIDRIISIDEPKRLELGPLFILAKAKSMVL